MNINCIKEKYLDAIREDITTGFKKLGKGVIGILPIEDPMGRDDKTILENYFEECKYDFGDDFPYCSEDLYIYISNDKNLRYIKLKDEVIEELKIEIKKICK